MWQAIEYVLLLTVIALVLWYLIIPKKECFTVILKSGVSYEGHIRYQGKRDRAALEAEIIAKVGEEMPGEQIARIYLG